MNLPESTMPPFDSEDRVAWNNFLKTRAGSRLLARAAATCPSLLASGDINAVLIRSGEVRGFGLAIQELALLSEAERGIMSELSAYPAPEDDAAWDDSRRLSSD